jgi:hypothetical protein
MAGGRGQLSIARQQRRVERLGESDIVVREKLATC